MALASTITVFQARFRDIDLKFIDAALTPADPSAGPLRASDHKAIRQASDAVDRLGARLSTMLADRLSGIGSVAHQALPKFTAHSRISNRPKRFWLNIDLPALAASTAEPLNLFVEFTGTQVTIGISVPEFLSDKDRKKFWSRLRKASPDAFQALVQSRTAQGGRGQTGAENVGDWNFSDHEAPVQSTKRPQGLNDWLLQKSLEKSRTQPAFTASKTLSNADLPIESIVAHLSDAARLFGQGIKDTPASSDWVAAVKARLSVV